MQRTNDSSVDEWSDLATPTWYSQAIDRGVAPQLMIQLCNTLQANPWFCMPHRASDAFVTAFATLVRDTLDPHLDIYLEYSNEVWNGIFGQAAYCEQQGLAQGLSANAYEARLRYHSQRSVQIFKIWESVFGSKNRLIRVLASQAANPWVGTTIMDWQNAYQSADALGIAPYMGGSFGDPATQSTVASWTVAQLLTNLQPQIAVSTGLIASNVSTASSRGLSVVAYEGGQHLAGYGGAENNAALTNLFTTANRDPGMKPIYDAYLSAWRESGATLFMNFSSTGQYTKWGCWGALEWYDQASSPKYEALLDFLKANPRWW